MALLDRLRPQPGWKHPDPAMRVAAVEALPDGEQAIVAAIAREDDSPRVRRAAVARLEDVDALSALSHGDADPQVRSDAAARLLALAAADIDEPRAARAAAGLTEERLIAQVARSARHLAVALEAVDRLTDTRALGSTARNAGHEAVRLRALERVADAGELEAIAVNTEHKDVGLAAVERIGDAGTLGSIAERARNKVVGRRARAIAREHEQKQAEERDAVESRARRHALLTEAVEHLDRVRDAQRGRAELARLLTDFEAAGPADGDAHSRFQAAAERIGAWLDQVEREAAEADTALAAREAATTARRGLLEQAETADGPELDERIAALRAEWAALPPLEGADARELARAFDEACARAGQRRDAREHALAVREQLAALAGEAERVAADADPSGGGAAWQDVADRWRALTAPHAGDPEMTARFEAAEAAWHARARAAEAERTRRSAEQRARLQELLGRTSALATAPDVSLRDLDHAIRDLRGAIDHAAAAGIDASDPLLGQMKAQLARLSPRLREQRETDEWRRWANAGIQEELVKRIEALRTGTDLPEVARQLRDLRRQWKAVSAGPRDEADQLWHRFKAAMDEVQARCDEHFGKVAAEQAANVARRQSICEQAEALAQSTDWIATADTLKRLQHEWNGAGPVPREQLAELARRFRAACDTFFTRRKTDLAERKHVWAENAQKKEALCARAEVLAQSTDWQAALTEIKQLQAEWKTVGAVRKNRSETLWKRFRGACDTFFERYGRRHEIAQQQRVQDREGAAQALEALLTAAPAADGSPPEGLVASVEAAWRRWLEAPGLPPDTLAPLRTRFDQALEQVIARYPAVFAGSRFDVAATLARRESLCADVEGAVKGTARQSDPGATPAATLAAMLKESLAANTIGGRVNEEVKLRAAGDRVRRAQQAWRELGPVFGEAGRALDARFHKACRRFFEQHPELRQAHPPRVQHHRR